MKISLILEKQNKKQDMFISTDFQAWITKINNKKRIVYIIQEIEHT